MLHAFVYQLRITRQNNKTRKNKNLEKLFRKNNTSPLLKTPEKTFKYHA